MSRLILTLAVLGAALGTAALLGARTSSSPKRFYACYAPSSGAAYGIKETDPEQQCAETTHVQFSWTDSSSTPRSSRVSQVNGTAASAPAGSEFTVATATCPAGTTLVGGSYTFHSFSPSAPPFVFGQGQSTEEPNRWEVYLENSDGTGPPAEVSARALCSR